MKTCLCIISLLFLFSCNNGKDKDNDINNNDSTELRTDQESVMQNRAAAQSPESENNDNGTEWEDTSKTSTNGLAGNYKKIIEDGNETSGNCNCYCIDLSFNSSFDICLVADKLNITVRAENTGNGTANLFFVAPVTVTDMEREIPWNDFDTNTPIATLKSQPDGNLELDWVGFAINGELAVDYAIFGKKTMEGTYKKQ